MPGKSTKHINLISRKVGYTLKYSTRARFLRLEIACDTGLVVTAPMRFDLSSIEKFISSKADWVLSHLDYFLRQPRRHSLGSGPRDYLKYKDEAKKVVNLTLDLINRHYNFNFKQVRIKNQRSRWGSCSRGGNLNFNYKIIKLPPALAEYIIAHELCHLVEFNHSKKFWNLLAETIPDWQARRSALNKYSVTR